MVSSPCVRLAGHHPHLHGPADHRRHCQQEGLQVSQDQGIVGLSIDWSRDRTLVKQLQKSCIFGPCLRDVGCKYICEGLCDRKNLAV